MQLRKEIKLLLDYGQTLVGIVRLQLRNELKCRKITAPDEDNTPCNSASQHMFLVAVRGIGVICSDL